jgi:ribonuclease BN (tRNA processing enzyme)
MRVLITGIGDAFTTRSFGTSALIEAPHGQVLLDCPELIHRVLHEATAASGWRDDVTTIDHIIITHLHGDHCNGLEMFGFYRRFLRGIDPTSPVPSVYATQPVLDRLWEKLAPSMDSPRDGVPSTLEDYFQTHLVAPKSEAQIAGLTVRCRFTGHPVPTIGLLISDGKSTLGWSGDTPFEQAHIDWLSEADLIAHESGSGAAHTEIESLNALPDALRAKMRLIHLPDDFDLSLTDIEPLRQGEVLTI